ncbi:MAG TPA: methyl-accepting chemotaxis protein, partial [Pseudomonas sp.]|nr:methyl-accepting chemotaxis protein [Pseudomonas sp.]
MYFRNLKIGTRAAVIFTLVALLVLILGLASLYRMHTMDKATDEVRTEWLPSIMLLDEVSMNLGRARALTLRSVLEESPSARAATLDKIADISKHYQEQIKTYKATATEERDRALYDAFLA